MSRRIPSLILALTFLLRPNLCAAEPASASSLRPVNSRETDPVLDKLTAGLEETGEPRDELAGEFLLFHRLYRNENVRPFPVDSSLGRDYDLSELDQPGPGQPLKLIQDRETGRSSIFLWINHAVRVPLDPSGTPSIGSGGHFDCLVCLARGWNPVTERWELVQWHHGPPLGHPGAEALRLFRNHLPRELTGLRDIQLFLSPEEDPGWKMENDPEWTPEVLRREWNDKLNLPSGETGIRSITIVPHFFKTGVPTKTGVSTVANRQGIGLFMHDQRGIMPLDPRYVEAAVRKPGLFTVFPWKEMKEGFFPILKPDRSEMELPSAAGLEENPMDQRIQSGEKVPLAEVRSALRLYFNRSVQSGGLFFERYLKTSERAFHGNPTRVWREVRGTLDYAIIRQKRESYSPEAALADATQTLLERFPRVEVQMARSEVKKVNPAWDRTGARVVRQELSAEEVYESFRPLEGQTIFRLPSAIEPSGWSEERFQPGARDFLQPNLQYALLRWPGGRMGIIPQSMLLEPSDPQTVRQFRRLLRETVSGQQRKEGRTQLFQMFGSRGTSRVHFQVRRRGRGAAAILLMSVPMESGKDSSVSLHLPRAFWGQVMELVPRWREGHLQLEVFALGPRRLVRVVQWQEKPPAFRRISSLKEEWKVEESARPRKGQTPTLDSKRGYRTTAELAQATGLPEDLLQELEKADLLYRDQKHRIPGELAILFQQIDRQVQAASYPLRALEELLGVQRSAAIEVVRRAKVSVIRQPGQRQLLSRENVLRVVLRKKVQDWAVGKMGGLIKWAEAAKIFGVNEDDLIGGWRDTRGRLRRVPYFDGVPLWVQYEGHRRLTRKGFESFRKIEEAARSQIRPDEAVLMDELKRRTQATRVALGQQLFNAVRALEERGIPSRILEHPLGEIQRIQLVPRDRLDEMFREMNHPTRWNRSQIQPDFWYSGRTAARFLHLDRSSLLGPIKRGKLQAKKIFNHNFILGASILSYRQPAGLEARRPSAGLEESPMDARITRAQKLMKQGLVREAVLLVLGALEYSALEQAPFSRWKVAHEVLSQADRELGLKDQLAGFDNFVTSLSVLGEIVSEAPGQLKSDLNESATRLLMALLNAYHAIYEKTYPAQFFREYWYGEFPSGLEEVPAAMSNSGLEESGPGVSKWRLLASWLRNGDPRQSAERLARWLRRDGEEHRYWRRALQWRIERKSESPLYSRPGGWMSIAQLLRRPAFTSEGIAALLEQMEELPVLSTVHVRDLMGKWEMPLGEVLGVLAEQGKGFILGSLVEGFPTPDSEIGILFPWDKEETVQMAFLQVPLKPGRAIRMRLLPWDDSLLVQRPFLPFQAETLLRQNESGEWTFNGLGLRTLFQSNQEIRDEVRAAANQEEALTEMNVAREAARIHREKLVPSLPQSGAGDDDSLGPFQARLMILVANLNLAALDSDGAKVQNLLDSNEGLLRQAADSTDKATQFWYREIQKVRLHFLAPQIDANPGLKPVVARDFLAVLPGLMADMTSGEMTPREQSDWGDWMSQALGFLIDKKVLNLSEMISSPGAVPEAVLWLAMTRVSMGRFLAIVQESGPAGNPLRNEELQQVRTRMLAYFMMAEVTAPSQQVWEDLSLDWALVSMVTDLLTVYERIALDVGGRTDMKGRPFAGDVARQTVLWERERVPPPDLLFREALLADDGATRFNAAAMGLKRLAWIANQVGYPKTALFMRQQAHKVADTVRRDHAAYARDRFWGRALFPDVFQSSGLEEEFGVLELPAVVGPGEVRSIFEDRAQARSGLGESV